MTSSLTSVVLDLENRHGVMVELYRDDGAVVQIVMAPRHKIPEGWMPSKSFNPYKHKPLTNGKHVKGSPRARSIVIPRHRLYLAQEIYDGKYNDIPTFVEHCNRTLGGWGVKFIDNDNNNDVRKLINDKSTFFACGPHDFAENMLAFLASYKT